MVPYFQDPLTGGFREDLEEKVDWGVEEDEACTLTHK
jgi:hypothetical protein